MYTNIEARTGLIYVSLTYVYIHSDPKMFFFPPVSVKEVECVLVGCQSETFRHMGGSMPEGHCLTVVFKGPRKSLDLLCQSQEEAQRWARGIRTLQEHVENMTQKEKLNQYPSLFILICIMGQVDAAKKKCLGHVEFEEAPGHAEGVLHFPSTPAASGWRMDSATRLNLAPCPTLRTFTSMF